MEERLSFIVKNSRKQILEVINSLNDAAQKFGFKEHIKDITGLLNCGLIALYHQNEKFMLFEMTMDSQNYGQHLSFRPRGIGLDVCPGCFVCGESKRSQDSNCYLHNIAAFVESKADGELIVEWFGGKARLDYRESEPNWIQVKVGSCDQHLPNLEKLMQFTSYYGVIRQKHIRDACKEK